MKTLFAICLLICVIVVINASSTKKAAKHSNKAIKAAAKTSPNALKVRKAAELKKWKKLYRLNQMKWSMLSLKQWKLDLNNKETWIKFETKWLIPGKDVAKWKKAKAAAKKKQKKATAAMWIKMNKEELKLSKESRRIQNEIRKLSGKPKVNERYMDEELAALNDPAPRAKHHKKDKKNKKKKHQKIKNKALKEPKNTPPPPPANTLVPDVTLGPIASRRPEQSKGIRLENKSIPHTQQNIVPHVTRGPMTPGNPHPMGMQQWNGMEKQKWNNNNNGMEGGYEGGNMGNMHMQGKQAYNHGGYEGGYGGGNNGGYGGGMNGGYGSNGGYNGGDGGYGGGDAEYMRDEMADEPNMDY